MEPSLILVGQLTREYLLPPIGQPLLDSPPPVHAYAQGSWGPAEADGLVEGFGRWHEPWVSA